MATTTEKVLEGQSAQRTQAKRATFAKLKNKKRAELEFTIDLEGDGEPVSFLFRAIGSNDYDSLLAKHPPTTEQKAEEATYNQDSFAPALLSRVCVEPVMDEGEWTEIWKSPSWNRGEIGRLFWTAIELCNRTFDLTPTETG